MNKKTLKFILTISAVIIAFGIAQGILIYSNVHPAILQEVFAGNADDFVSPGDQEDPNPPPSLDSTNPDASVNSSTTTDPWVLGDQTNIYREINYDDIGEALQGFYYSDFVLPEMTIEMVENAVVKLRIDKIKDEFLKMYGALEFFTIPITCGTTRQEYFDIYNNPDLCPDLQTITINQKGSYDFNVIYESRFVAFSCNEKNGDCTKDINSLKIGLVSDRVFGTDNRLSKRSIQDINLLEN